MGDFIWKTLTDWGLSSLIKTFGDHEFDEESFFCLDDDKIEKLIPKMGPMLKFKRRFRLLKCQRENEEAASSAQVFLSTSDASDKGKRRLDLQDDSSKCQPQTKIPRYDKRRSDLEERILEDVKSTIKGVSKNLPMQNKLSQFLEKKIGDLEIDKRELVGVFGKTGAGKSTLINTVIGKENLLPSGSVSACTSVMIKVEANKRNQKYEADIEFITREEWREELWSFDFLRGDANQENDQEARADYKETVEKLTALYGEEWSETSTQDLMDMDAKYFSKEIPEFLSSTSKTFKCESADELSAKLVKYTRTDTEDGGDKKVKRWYWPLVKCVTVRVPCNDLKHVTIVDLPGNGDRNRSRDKMWKEVVETCSTVWIVTDLSRPASDKDAWDILDSASRLMGNGGECQRIDFICTKSDQTGNLPDRSLKGVRDYILKRNTQAKEEVKKEFSDFCNIKKHFEDDCFRVFTVSSTEFVQQNYLNPNETEIPELQGILQELNDCHSETLNYVSGAHGILSLIQGASRKEGADRNTDVCRELEEKMKQELQKIRLSMQKTYDTFERCLTEGVEKSKSSWERLLKEVLYPPDTSGSGYHSVLRCVVKNGGTHKPKNRKLINLNMELTSCLTDSIDEEFKKTFPNERRCGPFNGIINSFSLETEKMRERQEYKDVELQLIFLKTEEEKMKTDLNKTIREQKKMIYSSLMETIKENMLKCYKKAAGFKGQDMLKNMRNTIENHVRQSKDVMFQRAKNVMLEQLENLMEEILERLEKTMQESLELSLKTDSDSMPEVKEELQKVKNYHNNLMGGQNEEPIIIGSADLPGPAAAVSP
ncbi:nuclear GTPase SLIP-GC-like [Epinephelus fuscoguttatus]|uniref:nuclear GTPase SLIP-GC-like n=1 Tax=Epinephelus fuscoguttatus TaxID=293821 RepID=UPI0020D00896|nr:nuclear GTPase SLIP-GC-like [Epinephelus fuscoguttatus]